MSRFTSFVGLPIVQIALLTIGAAAQYAEPTTQRKLLPVSWGPLVEPQYIEDLKAELANSLEMII